MKKFISEPSAKITELEETIKTLEMRLKQSQQQFQANEVEYLKKVRFIIPSFFFSLFPFFFVSTFVSIDWAIS
jgi:hypothetical protein